MFEPIDAQAQRDLGVEPVLLRVKKEVSEPNSPWSVTSLSLSGGCLLTFRSVRELFSYLKPESVRVHPEATVRPWATCQVIGDTLSFAAALGYV